jgi:hypothetical protein
LVLFGDTRLIFIPFKGNKSGEKVVLFWADVINLEEYREEREKMEIKALSINQ